MTTRTLLWLIPALFYGLFVAWYTDFGGPLSETEIQQFLQKIQRRPGFDEEALVNIERFMREDSGRQFIMVNIMEYARSPKRAPGAGADESAQQLMARYMDYMLPQLLRRACHPIYMGEAVHRSMDLVGIENAETWDVGALMRYRSRRALMEIIANADQADSHRYKVAALNKTIAFPVENVLNYSDPRLLLALLLIALTSAIAAFTRRP